MPQSSQGEGGFLEAGPGENDPAFAEDPGADFPAEAADVIDGPSIAPPVTSKKITLTLDEARARIGPEVLGVLEAKFNGNLAEVRAMDEKDQFL